MREERITSRKNPLLQQVKRLFASKKEREAAGLFAADGTKLLGEAVRYCPGLETVFLPASPAYQHFSSTMVREMIRYGQPMEQYVPAPVAEQWKGRS